MAWPPGVRVNRVPLYSRTSSLLNPQIQLSYLCLCSFLFISFEFVKAVGNSITKVSLPVGQEANARVMKHVAGQGPIYVRTLRKINLPELQVVESLFNFFIFIYFFMENGVFSLG